MLHPAVEQFIQNESKLHLAVTHVTSSLNTTLESIEDILKILEEKSGGHWIFGQWINLDKQKIFRSNKGVLSKDFIPLHTTFVNFDLLGKVNSNSSLNSFIHSIIVS